MNDVLKLEMCGVYWIRRPINLARARAQTLLISLVMR